MATAAGPASGGQPTAAPVIAVTARTLLSGGGALAGLSKPRIAVDGHVRRGGWGRNELPVAPGEHHVQVWVPYPLPRRRGPAEATVTVAPGATTELEYCVPVWPFLRGALGPAPQRHPGAWLTLGILAAALALLCLGAVWSSAG